MNQHDLERSVEAETLRLIESPKLAIPPAPMVALELQEIIAREDFGGSEIVAVVETDAALSATVLRHANSVARGGRVEITDLRAAVARVGLRNVANIAIAEELGRSFAAPGSLSELRSRLWQRSLVSAFVCQWVASLRGLDPNQAFTAGLLHDFGAAIVLAAAERILAGHAGLERSADAWLDFAMAHHLDVGRIVGDAWALGERLRAVMVHHHEPQGAPKHRPLLELVQMADRVCNLVEHHVSATPDVLAECVHDPEEARRLATELPKLGERIEQLSHSAKPAQRSASAVARASGSTLDAVVRPLAARVQVIDTPADLKPLGIARDGLVVLSDRPLLPNALARLSVEPSPGTTGPFELWCNPTLHEEVATGIRIELRPFALSGVAKRGFDSLYAAAG